MKSFFLLLLIVASIGVFIAVIIPRYSVIKSQRADISTYNDNLETVKRLQQSRDALIAQYNNIPKTDLDNITALLPDSVDNIRLIIQIDALATKNGLASLRSVDYSPDQIAAGNADSTAKPVPTDTTSDAASQRPYGEFVMSFETSGQYSNFLAFLSDLEQNLRLVDVTNIEFTPNTTTSGALSGIQYKVTIKTYWLKK